MASRLLLKKALCLCVSAPLWLIASAVLKADELKLDDGLYAEISVPAGKIVAKLFADRAPLTVANFVGLAEGNLGPKKGTPFFDGLTFHRVVPGFVVQGGDPLGTGEGSPGYSFPDEFSPDLRHDRAGILSMANEGPDTNGCQFFFTLAATKRLNYLHSVFGEVVQGLELLPRIRQGDKMTVKILRVGAQAEAYRIDAESFSHLVAKTPRYTSEKEPGPKAHFDDPQNLLPVDPPRALNFTFKLANFERSTGARIYFRLYPKFEPDTPEQKRNDFRRRLVNEMNLGKNGVLALYFADSDEWSLWIGDADVARFNPSGGQLMDRKEAFIAAARKEAETLLATLPQPVSSAQKLKAETDAVLDNLIALFQPKSR